MRRLLGLCVCSTLLAIISGVAPAGASDPDEVRVTLSPSDDTIAALPGINSQHGDCGWSVELHDGKAFWLACDPIGLASPVTNVVGIAPASNPDAVTLQTTNFIAPEPGVSCPNDPSYGYKPQVWPIGLAADPGTSTTRVVAFFSTRCHSDPETAAEVGIAEFVYNPNSVPSPIQATVLTYSLWTAQWSDGTPNVAHASAVYADPYYYTYACRNERELLNPAATPDDGRCTVARASDATDLADAESWSYWNGSSWIATSCVSVCTEAERRTAEQQEQPMELPTEPTIADPQSIYVPNEFSVRYDDELDLFVQASIRYQPSAFVWIRFAAAPEGPWSPPQQIRFACDSPGNGCYHVAPHPELLDGALAIHYYDPAHDGTFVDWRFLSVSLCEPGSSTPTFSDVPTSHAFFGQITDRAAACVIAGFSDGTFRPGNNITREAMLAFLWRNEGFPAPIATAPTYSDVSGTSPFRDQIGWAQDEGATLAFTSSTSTLSPSANVTRGQVADLLYRTDPTSGSFTPPAKSPFTDVATSHGKYAAITWAYENDIVCGFGDGSFRPGNNITREAAAAFMARDAGYPADCSP